MTIQQRLTLLGATIRGYRETQQMTLAALAGLAGLSKGHLSEIEHGKKNVSLDTIHRLASALRISVIDLLR